MKLFLYFISHIGSASTTTSSTSSTSSSTALTITWNSTATTIAGVASGTAGTAANQLYYPYGLALDSSNALYVADYRNNRIQKWASGATSGITVAGQSSGTAGSSSTALSMPVAIALDSAGNMYFTDRGNHRVMYWANGASSGTTVAGTTGNRFRKISLKKSGLVLIFLFHSQSIK